MKKRPTHAIAEPAAGEIEEDDAVGAAEHLDARLRDVLTETRGQVRELVTALRQIHERHVAHTDAVGEVEFAQAVREGGVSDVTHAGVR